MRAREFFLFIFPASAAAPAAAVVGGNFVGGSAIPVFANISRIVSACTYPEFA